MFNVTIIKLKDIIKIGVILILIYVFSNFILKTFKTKNLLSYSLKFDSVDWVKRGIEKESSIIKNVSNENNRAEKNIKSEEKDKYILNIKSILTIGANIFSIGDKKKRY